MMQVQLAFAPASPAEDWRILTLDAATGRGPSRILVVPGAMVLAREVEAQGRTDAQAQAAALAGLAPALAAPVASCICALGKSSGALRLVFVASRSSLDDMVASARALGFAPDAVIPDYALLPQPLPGRASVARRGEDVLARTAAGGFACQPELFDLLTHDLVCVDVDVDRSAAQTASAGGLALLPNLYNAASSTTGKKSHGLLPAGLAAAAALAVAASLPWVDAMQLDANSRELRARIDTIAREALPQGTIIANPLGQLRAASAAGERGELGLGLATALFEGLGKSSGVEMSRLALDKEGTLRASLVMPDTSLMQPLRDHLTASGIDLVETPGESLPNSIPVELVLRLGQ